MAEKKRLDTLLLELGLVPSREKAQALIMAGNVLLDETPATKSGLRVDPGAKIRIRNAGHKYVSRGGEKLEGALDDFGVDPTGKDVMDSGASTGGFTDCLLQRGAKSVCAVDVGYGQIALSLRNDPRVTVIEKTNARYLDPAKFPLGFDLITIDVSFISLLKVLPALIPLLRDQGEIIALVKPQFEAGRRDVGKNGVVTSREAHERVLNEVIAGAASLGLATNGLCFSHLPGPKGNIEFFIQLSREARHNFVPSVIAATVVEAHEKLREKSG